MSVTFNLHNCPFCQTELVNSTVHYSGYKKYSCLECPKCHSYFFTKNTYKILYKIAEKENRKLSSNIHYYDPDISIWNKNTIPKTHNKKITNKKLITKPKKNKKTKNTKRVQEINQLKHNKILARIKFGHANDCIYYENTYCISMKSECDPSSVECKFISNKETKEINHKTPIENKKPIKCVVLSYNRKCIYEEHVLINIKAIIRILTSDNKVIEANLPATYCIECNQYIILKTDYKDVKEKGTLLCQVIDKTPEYLAKHRNTYTATESKVHSLGYNVIKQGYNYTFTQRKIILANIIENYGITQHEILSMLDTNIARKINMPNYAEAVEKWQQDREFVANYEFGSVPEVLIDEVIVGKRK